LFQLSIDGSLTGTHQGSPLSNASIASSNRCEENGLVIRGFTRYSGSIAAASYPVRKMCGEP